MSAKIKSLSIDVVRHDLPSDFVAELGLARPDKDHGVLRIVTEDGVEGNCIIGEFWGQAEPLFRPILDNIKPELVGRDAAEREWLWTRHKYLTTVFRLTTKAWAPVDIALWDIAGKMTGQPIYRLLGVQRDLIPAYATYASRVDTPEGFVDEAERSISKGFSAYKIHPGLLATDDTVHMVDLVRRTVGSDVDLMLDPNCGYDFQKALTVGLALDDQQFRWFEDPVAYHDSAAIAELTRRLATPLSMSDQMPDQLFDTAEYVRRNAVRLPRGTALRLGITGLRKLCTLAEGFGLDCEIGVAGNASLNAANLHVQLSVANSAYHEYIFPRAPEEFGLTSYLRPDSHGDLIAPDAPGLGLELDEDWIAAHRIATLE